MSVLTNVIHFRGETVTLFATCKLIDQTPEIGDIPPTAEIQYVDAGGQIKFILPPTQMIPLALERAYLNFTIPYNAPLTAYTIVYRGIIDTGSAVRTEDFIVGNPSVTHKNPKALRYGPSSVVQQPKDYTVRPHPALPRGQF